MAELVLSTIGQTLGSRLPGVFATIGATLGRIGGAALGRSIDQQIFGTTTRYEGARLTDLHLQASTEGASIPAVYGNVRLAGQVIWAARFKERVEKHHEGGKGGGPRATSTEYTYSLSFAVGLCEGQIARIGRAWANGEPFDLSQVTWRLHTGAEDQAADPLIEAIETENAPAYRGLAYVVFEDLPLERFGNAIPQLSFEIVRPAPRRLPGPRFEERVKGVCLIPGSGEFVYATEPVLRRAGPGQEIAENVHAERDRANLLVSLDQIAVDFPNVETVLLVAAWFGDDLRCGHCSIRPGVELDDKVTTPVSWRAGGVDREGAHVVSLRDGAPAFGGTPSDASVLAAIAELKARGYKVGLYPFLLMDVPEGNALPDPYGDAEQAKYPWRGRITLDDPDLDQTATAADKVATFFGAAALGAFGASGGVPSYGGPDEFSYRRFILHYAKLAAMAPGGVDVFLLGSEMRGLTTVRDSATTFPAVGAMIDLADDVRGMLDAVARDVPTVLTYAADWSEYGGHQPQDGSGDVLFHLDPLWAHEAIDVVGIDWYPPLTDWRDELTHFDRALAADIRNDAYLEGRIEAGEDYDWYYATGTDRIAQTRTPISDGAHDEPWIFRAKDVRNFWGRAHYDRPSGVRSSTPTAWAPESKPIWFLELGCPAVDKGANAPNLFVDAKSDESALPPFSSGGRDDLIQRGALEAYLRYWDPDGAHNPVSSITGKPMLERAFLWAWDARPFPAFPARTDVWSDAASWRLGHWLNGRAGLSTLSEVVLDLCARAGVAKVDAYALTGAVSGYVVDSPADARAALEPLMAAYDFVAGERQGEIVFFHRDDGDALALSVGDLADGTSDTFAQRADAAETPVEARVRFIDAAKDYLIAGVSARRLDRAEGGAISIDAPLVLEADVAEVMAQAVLADRRAAVESLRVGVGPDHVALEPGDRVTLGEDADVFEIQRIEDAATRALELRRVRPPLAVQLQTGDPSAPTTPSIAPTPAFSVLDLPPLPGAEDDESPLAAVFAAPWLGAHDLYAGASITPRARATQPAIMGELLWSLWPGPENWWDDGNVARIKLYSGTLASASAEAVLNGDNLFAIENGGEWELLQARACELVAPNEYQLFGLLRGVLGSGHAMGAPHPVGARIIKLDTRLVRTDISAHEWNEPLAFVAPPAGALETDARAATASLTLPHAAVRPWAPAHLKAKRVSGGDVAVSWIRCARIGGDAWGPGDPPLGELAESYQLDIFDGTTLKRGVVCSTAAFTYTSAMQTTDFGSLPSSLHIQVAQIAASGATGLKKELTIAL